ncbi:superinfection immunity protein [Miniphocaeibacter massiliensis]|uniref:superinfection immunity protein n=1 Tax=Miniphocaeibacter massiliensis TaxID=2041841 RepID=UPI000C1C5D7C|nr:superinfection immunity protein [Miniphocaeibacter massiliensis]
MRCKYCGEEIKEEYLYCISCGKPTSDSIKEYKKEQENIKKQETNSIEYFEIEQQEAEKEHNYDFSEFLYDSDEDLEEEEEVDFSPKFNKAEDTISNTDRHQFDIDDDLDQTKERKFRRSDFKIYDEIRKNKSKEKQKKTSQRRMETEGRKEKNYRQEVSYDDYINGNDIKLEKIKKKRKTWKKIRNFLYNIIAAIGIWILYTELRYPVIEFVANNITEEIYTLDAKFVELVILVILIFLFTPFLVCKGNAKVPLFFFSILLSWTIIGWIILMVVAISSNIKFKRIY